MSSTLAVVDTEAAVGPMRFHISLNVDDLARSIAFYQVLFDVPPAKRQNDYAKFEIDVPPLVLSLEPNRAPQGGKLNHLGFRLASQMALVEMQRRLESHGISTQREEGVECCYARQTKFWLGDPDGNLWEIYTLDEDLDHRGMGQAPKQAAVATLEPTPSIWAHRLGEAFPARLMIETDGVDDVLLQGTFNDALTPAQKQARLAEVMRVLKPGGRLTLHQLSAKTTLEQLSQRLPGPAAAVSAIPSAAQLIDDLQTAGFTDLSFEKLGSAPCFVADGVECRETRLVGFKPHAVGGPIHLVLYKGPFRQIVDDRGRTYQRGEWIEVDDNAWKQLQVSPSCEQFVL